jgi:hypothetical protein
MKKKKIEKDKKRERDRYREIEKHFRFINDYKHKIIIFFI